MEKWGLGYEEVLSSKFPKLIHCRISGFGATGPLGGAPGYDAIVQAMTGMMSINGHASGGDVRVGAPVVDMGTGLYATIGILMAIQERHKSGLGQFIDMSLYDSALALMHPHTGNYFLSKKPGTATGNAHPNIAPYDKFKTATNEIFMGIGNDAGFVRLCKALNLDELITDKRFLSNGDRVENRIALTKYLEDALSNVDGVEFSEKLLAAGIPAGPVRNIEEAINHPQTKERQMTISKDEYKGVSSPIKFSRSRSVGVKHKPPIIGQHTKGILKEAGYNEDAINKLLSEEIVFQNKP
jgi:formyl-CoA transferase